MKAFRLCILAGLALFVAGLAAPEHAWVAAWAASPAGADPDPNEPLLNIENQTVRERVRLSMGGAQLRIRLSNEFGTAPLLIGSVTVAAPVDLATIKPGSTKTVTFGGQASILIPAGAPVLSDPVTIPIARGSEISLSLYFPKRVSTPTLHGLALKRAVISQQGDYTRAEKIGGGTVSESSICVSAVLVPAQPSQRLIVALGDSITDGDRSTVEADHNWPGDFARRLGMASESSNLSIVNAGMVGNRLLSDGSGISASFGVSALARFDRDVLSLPGVTHIVLLEGINDIAFPGTKMGGRFLADPMDVRTPEDLIAAYQQLISRAHAHGIKIFGATMTPFEDATFSGYYSESKEKIRQAVNQWIRTGGAFDGVIDFDVVLRDPDHPSRLLPQFASKDHLHPNDAGYQAMTDAVDMHLFR
jgi:lysophospholipase L1-like esterase